MGVVYGLKFFLHTKNSKFGVACSRLRENGLHGLGLSLRNFGRLRELKVWRDSLPDRTHFKANVGVCRRCRNTSGYPLWDRWLGLYRYMVEGFRNLTPALETR